MSKICDCAITVIFAVSAMCMMVAMLFGVGSLFLQAYELGGINKSHVGLCLFDQNSERLMHIYGQPLAQSLTIDIDTAELNGCIENEKEKALSEYRHDALIGTIGAGMSALVFGLIAFYLYREKCKALVVT